MGRPWKVSLSEKRTALEKRGWFFTKKETGLYVAFIAGDKENTIISSNSMYRIVDKIIDNEKKKGINVFNILFDNVPEIMVDEIEGLCKKYLNRNTTIVDFSAYGKAGVGDKYSINFKYHQVSNDPGHMLAMISDRRILKYVDLTESILV